MLKHLISPVVPLVHILSSIRQVTLRRFSCPVFIAVTSSGSCSSSPSEFLCGFRKNEGCSSFLERDYFMIVISIRDVFSYTWRAKVEMTKVTVAIYYGGLTKITSVYMYILGGRALFHGRSSKKKFHQRYCLEAMQEY